MDGYLQKSILLPVLKKFGATDIRYYTPDAVQNRRKFNTIAHLYLFSWNKNTTQVLLTFYFIHVCLRYNI